MFLLLAYYTVCHLFSLALTPLAVLALFKLTTYVIFAYGPIEKGLLLYLCWFDLVFLLYIANVACPCNVFVLYSVALWAYVLLYLYVYVSLYSLLVISVFSKLVFLVYVLQFSCWFTYWVTFVLVFSLLLLAKPIGPQYLVYLSYSLYCCLYSLFTVLSAYLCYLVAYGFSLYCFCLLATSLWALLAFLGFPGFAINLFLLLALSYLFVCCSFPVTCLFVLVYLAFSLRSYQVLFL